MEMQAPELYLGAAGEHLVCADLLLRGIAATRTGIPGPWDVVAETKSGQIIRIQVKTTQRPRNFLQQRQTHLVGYTWGVRHGKGGHKAYADGLVDVFALVALDSRKIAYLAARDATQTVQIVYPGDSKSPTAKRFDLLTWERALERLSP